MRRHQLAKEGERSFTCPSLSYISFSEESPTKKVLSAKRAIESCHSFARYCINTYTYNHYSYNKPTSCTTSHGLYMIINIFRLRDRMGMTCKTKVLQQTSIRAAFSVHRSKNKSFQSSSREILLRWNAEILHRGNVEFCQRGV